MPHKRSIRKQQKRFLRKLLFQAGFRDGWRAETVNVLSWEELARKMQEKFGWVDVTLLRHVRGEVMVDSRGQGSLQHTPDVGEQDKFY